MYNPPHPGEILLEDVLPGLNMKIKDFADHLGFARETVSRVLHGKAKISTDLAWRLEQAGISTARLWLSLQVIYDIWQIKNKPNKKYIDTLIAFVSIT